VPICVNAAGKPTRLTDALARAIATPEPIQAPPAKRGGAIPRSTARYEIWWCPDTTGFGLRVSSSGDKAYVAERRVDGKTVRRTLGKAVGRGAISAEAARGLQKIISGELQVGVDRAEVKREQRKTELDDALTLRDAIKDYVKGKRIGKSALPLKERTRADYLAMVEPGRLREDGERFIDGPLYKLADKSIHRLTAKDIQEAYKEVAKRGQRRAVYAMQVLRAVLNWHGVQIEDSPLAKTTAGSKRIILSGSAGDPKPIPSKKLGAWWQAATAMTGSDAADGCRLILLTGCRPGEIFGSNFQTGLLVGDVDLDGAQFTLGDTKNRKDHTVMLSTQALAIVTAHCKGKKAGAKVFEVVDPGKTLDRINAVAKVSGITPHKLRHTFASVAEGLVSVYALKRMMNHGSGSDVTGEYYVGKSEEQLRAAWQAVADFIEKSVDQ
jgi:integrase